MSTERGDVGETPLLTAEMAQDLLAVMNNLPLHALTCIPMEPKANPRDCRLALEAIASGSAVVRPAQSPPVRAAEPDMAVGLDQRQHEPSERASLSGAVPLPVCEYCRHPLQKERDSETRFCPNPGCRRFLVPAVPSTKEPKL